MCTFCTSFATNMPLFLAHCLYLFCDHYTSLVCVPCVLSVYLFYDHYASLVCVPCVPLLRPLYLFCVCTLYTYYLFATTSGIGEDGLVGCCVWDNQSIENQINPISRSCKPRVGALRRHLFVKPIHSAVHQRERAGCRYCKSATRGTNDIIGGAMLGVVLASSFNRRSVVSFFLFSPGRFRDPRVSTPRRRWRPG